MVELSLTSSYSETADQGLGQFDANEPANNTASHDKRREASGSVEAAVNSHKARWPQIEAKHAIVVGRAHAGHGRYREKGSLGKHAIISTSKTH